MVGIAQRKGKAGLTNWGEEWQEGVKRTRKGEPRRSSREKICEERIKCFKSTFKKGEPSSVS